MSDANIIQLSPTTQRPAWRATGQEVDYEDASETCELCGMTGLRYHFEIADQNDPTNVKWIGSRSTCWMMTR